MGMFHCCNPWSYSVLLIKNYPNLRTISALEMKSKTGTTRMRAGAGRGNWVLVSEEYCCMGKASILSGERRSKEELALLLDLAKHAELGKELERPTLITP